MPMRVQRTLTGVGGVQGLDGQAHRHRKGLFVDLLDGAAATAIAEVFAVEWARVIDKEPSRVVSVLDSASLALCAAVSQWVGVTVEGAALRQRTDDLRAMIESGARIGPGHWRGLLARRRAERGLARTVRAVRRAPDAWGHPLREITTWTDVGGNPLPERIAAVEVLNVLRPTVAIARFVAFAAHAIAVRPGMRGRLAGDLSLQRSFVHEVRRFYPFFPVVAATAVQDVEFRGHTIPAGRRVLLDLYGTDRHPTECPRADEFVADRFAGPPDAFDVIPQGGGEVRTGHRCPGEAVTVAVLEASLRVLVDRPDWLAEASTVDNRTVPTTPSGGLVLHWLDWPPILRDTPRSRNHTPA